MDCNPASDRTRDVNPLGAGLAWSAALLLTCAGTAQSRQEAPPPDSAPPSGAEAGAGESSAGSEQGGIKVSEHLTVDMFVQDEDLATVLQMLSIQSQRNIIASSDVSATVSANLYGVTFYEALDAILSVNGYGYKEKGNFIYVYPAATIAEMEKENRQLVSRVVQLNYLNANDAAEFVTPLLSSEGQIKTNGDVGAYALPEDTPTGDEQFALSATLVIYDYAENVDEIQKLLEQLDTRPQQVLVEATVLQTQLTEANAFGIDFAVLADVDFDDFFGIGGPLSVANNLISGENVAATPDDGRSTGIVGSPGDTSGPATFKAAVIHDDVSVFLRALDEVTDFTVLSKPKILALNRQPARVLVGRKLGYLNTTSTETSTTQSVEFLDTGTQLNFRPFIAKDGMIRLELKPRVSEGVIRTATDATGAAVTIPDEITQELTTNVIVRDGSTVVLGGLFKESTNLKRSQVPVLGDIPLIGTAFRGHEDSIDRSEIIFMIKPTIVNETTLAEQGARALDETERIRAGTRQGLLPWSREKQSSALNVEAERLEAEGKIEEAIWTVQRSLQLCPTQADAIAILERLQNSSSRWPSRSALDRIIDQKAPELTAQNGTPAAGMLSSEGAGHADEAAKSAVIDGAGSGSTQESTASEEQLPRVSVEEAFGAGPWWTMEFGDADASFEEELATVVAPEPQVVASATEASATGGSAQPAAQSDAAPTREERPHAVSLLDRLGAGNRAAGESQEAQMAFFNSWCMPMPLPGFQWIDIWRLQGPEIGVGHATFTEVTTEEDE